MIVEVQAYDTAGGFSGHLDWSTVSGYIYKLEPTFSATSLIIEWESTAIPGRTEGISILSAPGTYRLRTSELDDYQFDADEVPTAISTSLRRTFVATSNVEGPSSRLHQDIGVGHGCSPSSRPHIWWGRQRWVTDRGR